MQLAKQLRKLGKGRMKVGKKKGERSVLGVTASPPHMGGSPQSHAPASCPSPSFGEVSQVPGPDGFSDCAFGIKDWDALSSGESVPVCRDFTSSCRGGRGLSATICDSMGKSVEVRMECYRSISPHTAAEFSHPALLGDKADIWTSISVSSIDFSHSLEPRQEERGVI